jgi:hypothetical protein
MIVQLTSTNLQPAPIIYRLAAISNRGDDPELWVIRPQAPSDDPGGAWNGSTLRDRSTANAGSTPEAG